MAEANTYRYFIVMTYKMPGHDYSYANAQVVRDAPIDSMEDIKEIGEKYERQLGLSPGNLVITCVQRFPL